MPSEGLKLITFIFNAVFRLTYFPLQRKVAQVIVIQKLGKPAHETSSYRPISLLRILLKVLETIIQRRLNPIIDSKNIIANHQFGFRTQPLNSTTGSI